MAARAYAAAGHPVMPVDPRTHAPLLPTATTDGASLDTAWFRHPNAAVAVQLGPSLVAIEAASSEPASHAVRVLVDSYALGPADLQAPRMTWWLFRSSRALPNTEIATGVRILGTGLLVLPPSEGSTGAVTWRKGHSIESAPPAGDWIYRLIDDPNGRTALTAAPREAVTGEAIDDDWMRDLPRNKHGALINSFAVLCSILRNAPEFKGRLRWNEMFIGPDLDGRPIEDSALGDLREAIELRYRIEPSAANLAQALITVASQRSYHPVRQYLDGLTWDGIERICRVGPELLGVESPITQAMLRAWFISAVARVLQPGCKVDTALVLTGKQGFRKSSFFRALASPWFSDTHMNLGDKDSRLQLSLAWIYEWAEIEQVTSRKQASEVKSFVTSQEDTFRPPFQRAARRVLRSGVIVGSTNLPQFLNDPTGSRRFWCVPVAGEINLETLRSWRDQLWAEARALYLRGEPWYLDRAGEVLHTEHSEQYQEEDPWFDLIAAWLRVNSRPDYLVFEISSGACSIPKADLDKGRQMRIATILRQLGLTREKRRIERNGVRQEPTWVWVNPSFDANAAPAPESEGFD